MVKTRKQSHATKIFKKKLAMQELRMNEEFKAKERAKSAIRMKIKKSLDTEFAKKQKSQSDEITKAKKVTDFSYSQNRNSQSASIMEVKRILDQEFSRTQKKQSALIMKSKRDEDEEFALKQKELSALIMKSKRATDEEFATKQKELSALIMKSKRDEDEEFALKQKELSALIMKSKRDKDEEFALKQKELSALIMKSKRDKDEEFALKQKEQSVMSMRKKRQVVEKREIEKEKDRLAKEEKKKQNNIKKEEKAKKIQLERELKMDEFYSFRLEYAEKLKEKIKNKNRSNSNQEVASTKRLLKFINEIREVPSKICSCCECLYFSDYVKKFTKNDRRRAFDEYLKNSVKSSKAPGKFEVIHFKNFEEFEEYIYGVDSDLVCLTCHRNILKGKIPLINPKCGIQVGKVPKELSELSALAERFLVPLFPFMQIKSLQQHALNPQLGIKGAIINVIPKMDVFHNVLPRKYNETSTIQIDLKRDLSHKSSYMCETVNVHSIKAAAKILENSELYKEYNIKFDYDSFEKNTFSNEASEEHENSHDTKSKNEHDLQNDMNEIKHDMSFPTIENLTQLNEKIRNSISSHPKSKDQFIFVLFENSFTANYQNITKLNFKLMCAYNSIVHSFIAFYKINDKFNKLLEENINKIAFFRFIRDVINCDNRNQMYIDFLYNNNYGEKVKKEDIERNYIVMENDSALILEKFFTDNVLEKSCLLPSYHKVAICNNPECGGKSKECIENSMIYIANIKGESLLNTIQNKIIYQTNFLNESEKQYSCGTCGCLINSCGNDESNIKFETIYNDLIIVNVTNYEEKINERGNKIAIEYIPQLNLYNDIPLNLYLNNETYDLAFFINKKIGHYNAYYNYKKLFILLDDLFTPSYEQNKSYRHEEYVHEDNKIPTTVNPNIIMYLKREQEQEKSVSKLHGGGLIEDTYNLFSESDESIDIEEIEKNINKKYEDDVNEDDKVEELLNDAPDEVLLLKDVNVDDVINEGLETDIDSSNINSNEVKIIAPCQGQKIVPSSKFPHYDELCFPSIYGGQKMTYNREKISYTRVIRAEIKHYRRNRCQTTLVLFKAKEKIKRDLGNAINVQLRKNYKTDKLTAKDMRDNAQINRICLENIGCRLLKNIRIGPSYLKSRRAHAMAMLRQFKFPTFFFSGSYGENYSAETLQLLKKIFCGIDISLADALKMTIAEKTKYVRDDPVSCAEIFNHKVNKLGTFTCDENGLFGQHFVTHYIKRKEAQGRGTMHTHQIWWCKNSPDLNIFEKDEEKKKKNEKEVSEFIDKMISTEYKENHPCMKFHIHKCGKVCLKNGSCRFDIPHFVSKETKIIYPMERNNITLEMKKNLKNIRVKMREYRKQRVLQSFEDMLNELLLTELQYYEAIRCYYKRIVVLYKRQSNAVAINSYNPILLDTWESNHDLQFIPDPYGFIHYLLKYCLKADEGMLHMMNEAEKLCRSGDKSMIETLRKIANIFHGTSFITAQQAVEEILGFATLKFSHVEKFINTNRPDRRTYLKKSKKMLDQLDDESKDVMLPDFIDEYINRPNELDNINLADFAANYKKHGDNENESDNEHDDDDDGENKQNKKRSKEYELRTKPRCIRWVNFKPSINFSEYCREMVMLFIPWRNEQEELLNDNIEDIFETNKADIMQRYSTYCSITPDELDKILKEVDEALKAYKDDEIRDFLKLEEKTDYIPKVDIFDELGIDENKKTENFKNKDDIDTHNLIRPAKIDEKDLHENLRKLNEKQQVFVQHVYHIAKTIGKDESPPKILLLGPAGTGKSLVLRTIYQLLTHFYEHQSGASLDSTKVLLAAYTGVAAFLIGGNTTHSAFCLQVGYKGKSLENETTKNAIRAMHKDVEAIIIDECSFLSRETRGQIDFNCRNIYGDDKNSFGNKLVILIGDLYQLAPVMGKLIFEKMPKLNPKRMPDVQKLMKDIIIDDVWEKEFKLFELTEIVRQKNENYQIALNNLAKGTMTDADLKLIKDRTFKNENDIPLDAIRLYYTNKEVRHHNETKIREYPGDSHEVEAEDEIRGKNLSLDIKNRLLEDYQQDKISSINLKSSVLIKLQIKYMIIVNIDVSDGLVNGAFGTLKHISFNKDKTKILLLWLQFENSEIGKKAKMPFIEYMRQNNIALDLVPIKKFTFDMTVSANRKKLLSVKVNHEALRTQFPVTPCEAMTIHKVQGLTLKKVCIDLRNLIKDLSNDLKYVALSRCDYEGLFILGEFKKPSCDSSKKITNEIERLRNEAPLKLSFYNFNQNCGIKIIFQNIRSFNAHKFDILNIGWYWKADVLIFAETNVNYVEDDEIGKNFTVLYPTEDCYRKKQRSRGLIILCKDPNKVKNLSEPIIEEGENENKIWQLDLRHFEISNHYVITGYKSPKTPYKVFYDKMNYLINKAPKDYYVTIIGDFNINMKIYSDFRVFLEKNHFINYLKDQHTTDARTQIDIVYSKSKNGLAGTYASYFSDHYAIFYQTEYDFSKENKEKEEKVHKDIQIDIHKERKASLESKISFNIRKTLPFSSSMKYEYDKLTFNNSINAYFEDTEIQFYSLCAFNSIFHGFKSFFKNDSIFALIANENKKNIKFYNFLIDMQSTYINSAYKQQFWIDFILNVCDNIILVTPSDVKNKKKDMTNDVIEVLSAFFFEHISVYCEKIKCTNESCKGFCSKFETNLITIFDMDRDLRGKLNERIYNYVKDRNMVCEMCCNTIENVTYDPIFCDMLIINLTFAPGKFDTKISFNEPIVNIEVSEIPHNLLLNEEVYNLKLLFHHPPNHFVSFYKIDKNSLVKLDDLEGIEKTLTMNEFQSLKLNVKSLVYLKSSKTLQTFGEELIPNENENMIKYALMPNTIVIKRENKSIKLVCLCTFNSFLHGIIASCNSSEFLEYMESNRKKFLYFDIVHDLRATKTQEFRNNIWYAYLRQNIPQTPNRLDRHYPFTLIGNNTYDMTWSQDSMIETLLNKYISYTLHYQCQNCDYQRSRSIRIQLISINDDQNYLSFNEQFTSLLNAKINTLHVICKCNRNLSYFKADFNDLLIFRCGFLENNIEIPLSEVPRFIHLNDTLYNLLFVINYQTFPDHFNCFALSRDNYIFIDDIQQTHEILNTLNSQDNKKIHPIILVFFKS